MKNRPILFSLSHARAPGKKSPVSSRIEIFSERTQPSNRTYHYCTALGKAVVREANTPTVHRQPKSMTYGRSPREGESAESPSSFSSSSAPSRSTKQHPAEPSDDSETSCSSHRDTKSASSLVPSSNQLHGGWDESPRTKSNRLNLNARSESSNKDEAKIMARC